MVDNMNQIELTECQPTSRRVNGGGLVTPANCGSAGLSSVHTKVFRKVVSERRHDEQSVLLLCSWDWTDRTRETNGETEREGRAGRDGRRDGGLALVERCNVAKRCNDPARIPVNGQGQADGWRALWCVLELEVPRADAGYLIRYWGRPRPVASAGWGGVAVLGRRCMDGSWVGREDGQGNLTADGSLQLLATQPASAIGYGVASTEQQSARRGPAQAGWPGGRLPISS